MKTTTSLGLSSLIVLTLAAFTGAARPTILPAPSESSSFFAELRGDLHASLRGTARFGTVKAARAPRRSACRLVPTARMGPCSSRGPTAAG